MLPNKLRKRRADTGPLLPHHHGLPIASSQWRRRPTRRLTTAQAVVVGAVGLSVSILAIVGLTLYFSPLQPPHHHHHSPNQKQRHVVGVEDPAVQAVRTRRTHPDRQPHLPISQHHQTRAEHRKEKPLPAMMHANQPRGEQQHKKPVHPIHQQHHRARGEQHREQQQPLDRHHVRVQSLHGRPKEHRPKQRQEPQLIRCADGTDAWLNDDYCDCTDGLDEPQTSACAHLTVGHATFLCEDGSAVIFSSRVGDGVVDCPDGSDEQG